MPGRSDARLELDVALRRAAAWRLSDDHALATDLARGVRERAATLGDRKSELSACIELGQNLLRTELGEGYSVVPTEADLDGAQEAFERSIAIAEALGDESLLAAATRELAVIGLSRLRAWVVAGMVTGEHPDWQCRLLAGEELGGILAELPVARSSTKPPACCNAPWRSTSGSVTAAGSCPRSSPWPS